MAFTLACAQLAPRKGALSENLDAIADAAIQAAGEGADLVVFPEASTSGYFLEGGVLEAALTEEELVTEVSKRLGDRLAAPLDLLIGFYQKSEGNLYNSAAYIELNAGKAKSVHVYRKFFLPTYGVFDEERFVSRGSQLGVFDTRFGRLGVLICEDLWHSIMPALVALNGAQVLLVPSASPGRGFGCDGIESLNRYRRLMSAASEEHGVWTVNCQLCGFEGGKGFVGGSAVIDPMGCTVATSPIAEPHLLVAQVDLDLIPIARAKSPLLSDLESAWSDLQRIISSQSVR
jgi:predicted amidohydrolase